jgi:hypothetical protein
MRRSTLFVILLILAAAAFLLLDFQAVRGQFNTENQVATFSASINPEQPLPQDRPLDLYVIGPEALAAELSRELAGQLGANPYIGEVNLRQAPPQKASASPLVVEIPQPGVFWTPVFGRTTMAVDIAYASDGEVDWIDADVVEFSSGEPVARVRGEFQFRDTAFGLLSRPGYYSYLSENIAAQVSSSLETSLARQGK